MRARDRENWRFLRSFRGTRRRGLECPSSRFARLLVFRLAFIGYRGVFLARMQFSEMAEKTSFAPLQLFLSCLAANCRFVLSSVFVVPPQFFRGWVEWGAGARFSHLVRKPWKKRTAYGNEEGKAVLFQRAGGVFMALEILRNLEPKVRP